MECIHKYNDGTCLYRMSARMLLLIPVWKGQRILDPDHAASIRKDVGDNIRLLDHGYTLLRYEAAEGEGESIYIVDGQHWAQVLKEYYAAHPEASDFVVTSREKCVASEEEALAFFRAVNHAKPIDLKTEPAQLVNGWLEAILAAFNTEIGRPLIRPQKTHAPYLGAEVVRRWLQEDVQRGGFGGEAALAALRAVNSRLLALPPDESSQTYRVAAKLRFMLSFSRPADWTAQLRQNSAFLNSASTVSRDSAVRPSKLKEKATTPHLPARARGSSIICVPPKYDDTKIALQSKAAPTPPKAASPSSSTPAVTKRDGAKTAPLSKAIPAVAKQDNAKAGSSSNATLAVPKRDDAKTAPPASAASAVSKRVSVRTEPSSSATPAATNRGGAKVEPQGISTLVSLQHDEAEVAQEDDNPPKGGICRSAVLMIRTAIGNRRRCVAD